LTIKQQNVLKKSLGFSCSLVPRFKTPVERDSNSICSVAPSPNNCFSLFALTLQNKALSTCKYLRNCV